MVRCLITYLFRGVKINLINLLHGVFKNIYGHENGGYLFLLKKAPRGDIEK